MSCQERSGFLFAHACDQPAAWACTRCAKMICAAHTRTTAEGQCCIGCAREVMATQEQQQNQQQQQTDGYRDTDDPYFYYAGSRSTYDADDRRAFDTSASPQDGEWEKDPGAS
jgi:hypothetical protein